MSAAAGARPFELDAAGVRLAGEVLGEGPPVVLAHGITATRRYVVHGSRALARAGHAQISYDARGHGESGAAAAGDPEAYGYGSLAADLGAVIAERASVRPVICGDSMGANTAACYALANADRLAGVVAIRPASLGIPPEPDALAHWERLAEGLELDGVDGFMSAYERDLDVAPAWAETILRFTRERLELHRDPVELARPLRVVPGSLPFEGMTELEALELPVLVVASRDEADPGHPLAVAEAWAEALPQGRLTVEEPGASPLAWQGGRLAREIAAFCAQPAVAERQGR